MTLTNHLWTALLMAALPLSLGAASAAGPDDAKLQAYFHQYLDASFRLHPLDATRLGDHRFDHLLDDLSAKARTAWTAHLRKTLDDLPRQIDVARLSPAGRIDFEIFRHELVKSLWIVENLDPLERDPRVYGEYISDSVFLLLTQSTLPKETNLANAIARMAHIPQVVADAKANLHNPSRVATETAIRQNRGAIAFYEHDLFELAGDTPQLPPCTPPPDPWPPA